MGGNATLWLNKSGCWLRIQWAAFLPDSWLKAYARFWKLETGIRYGSSWYLYWAAVGSRWIVFEIAYNNYQFLINIIIICM